MAFDIATWWKDMRRKMTFGMRRFGWKTTVLVLEKNAGGGLKPVFDKARVEFNEKGEPELYVWGYATTIDPAKYANQADDLLVLFSPRRGELAPAIIDDKGIEAIPDELKECYLRHKDRAHDYAHSKEVSAWEKLMPLIAVFVAGLSIAIILFIAIPYLMQAGGNVAGACANAISSGMSHMNVTCNVNYTLPAPPGA